MSALYYAEIVTDSSLGDRIELIGSSSSLNLTAECPWSGDTETGFGRDVTVQMSVEHAKQLRAAISAWLRRHGEFDEPL